MARPLIICPAAIAQRQVQIAVRAEGDGPAVMVHLGLVYLEDDPLSAHIDCIGIVLRYCEKRQTVGAAVAFRSSRSQRGAVEYEYPTVLDKIGMKRHPQQPPFIVARG